MDGEGREIAWVFLKAVGEPPGDIGRYAVFRRQRQVRDGTTVAHLQTQVITRTEFLGIIKVVTD